MSASIVIAGVGCVDATGVSGTGGIDARWDDLGVTPGGTARTYRELCGRPHPNSRRLDLASRALVMAAAATGIERIVPPDARASTALLVESLRGSLETDRRFAASLANEMVDSGAFPYTLSNMGLGEVAIAHDLRGVTMSLSIGPGVDGDAFAEGLRLLEHDGEARFAVVAHLECLETPCAGIAADFAAIVVLLAVAPAARSVLPMPASPAGVFASLASAVREL